ncbi:hypothetical protein [Pseudorhodoplanes sp.]|uniref:hypothetical protein n=1 Tax=Pseudorhodoplanes sp. TaxID=1934341 RepID=UPI003D0E2D46
MKNLLHKLALSGFVLTASLLNQAHALEMSASSGNNTGVLNGVNARIEASEAVTTALINKILTCNNKKKVYASDSTVSGRDSDGCVGADSDLSSVEIYKQSKTVSVPLTCSAGSSRFSSCKVNFNVRNYIDGSKIQTGDIRISFLGYFKSDVQLPSTYSISGPYATSSQVTTARKNIDGDSYWATFGSVNNGLVTLEAYNCRMYTSAKVRDITLTYSYVSVRQAP